MTVTTSVRCDQGRPGPDRCAERLDLAIPADMTRAISVELRRAGWADLKSGQFCPSHSRRRP